MVERHIGISDSILLKPAQLTEEEFTVMKTHVTLGVDILSKSNWLQSARDVVEFHHEKFAGSGYMRGLQGEEIPINARIFAIVDVFDALISKRPYKEPLPFEEAMAILHRDSGSHFDPRLVAAFDGIVEPLYREVSGLPDDAVEEMLQAIIQRYFLAESPARSDGIQKIQQQAVENFRLLDARKMGCLRNNLQTSAWDCLGDGCAGGGRRTRIVRAAYDQGGYADRRQPVCHIKCLDCPATTGKTGGGRITDHGSDPFHDFRVGLTVGCGEPAFQRPLHYRFKTLRFDQADTLIP